MLSIRKLQKCANEPKLHEGKLVKNHKKAGQKVVNWVSSVAKFRKLGKFATCEISQVWKIRNLRNFAGWENSQPAKFVATLKISTACFTLVQQFCSKFPLIRACTFEFGSGSSWLNRIEENEAFDLQNY